MFGRDQPYGAPHQQADSLLPRDHDAEGEPEKSPMSRNFVGLRTVLVGTGSILVLLLLLLGLGRSKVTRFIPSSTGNDGSLQNIQNATLGFQHIFAINLPSRTDHRDQFSLAAHFTGLRVEYVDGVTEVDERGLPPGGEEIKSKGVRGSWRAHMNVLRMIVEQNITTALVFEDDTDWDIRIKSQMQDFARASRLLTQPRQGTTDQYLDPTFPRPTENSHEVQEFDITTDTTTTPTTSPYGDVARWDLLWLGHCGNKFPPANSKTTPLGRAVVYDDETVPEKQRIDPQFGDKQLVQQYPEHTRVVSRAHETTCTLAYAITLPTARRFLYELAMVKMTAATDIMFRDMCDGLADRPMQSCFSVQPELFQMHRPVGRISKQTDIGDAGGAYFDTAYTVNIRWSTRVNFPKLVYGSTNYTDSFPDRRTKVG
ncbi:hypothetical protein LTR74_000720 [Friedmanniomyces endolithicus]|nr:hypothetical protein LTR74_000720 [Friedmanniomyces endolithicus]